MRRDVGLLAVMHTIVSLNPRWRTVAFTAGRERVAVFSRENRELSAAPNGGDSSAWFQMEHVENRGEPDTMLAADASV